MSLKYRTGQGTSASDFTDLVVKVGDTLPIGTEVDYDGQTAPAGWQEVDETNLGDVVVDSIRSKNMLDERTLINGSVSNTGISASTTRVCTSEFIKVKPSTTYTVSFSTTANINNMNVSEFTSDSFPRNTETGWVSNFTFTTGSTTKFVLLAFRNSGDATITPSNMSNVQLEENSTATTYAPFQDLANKEVKSFTYTLSNGAIYNFYKCGKIVQCELAGNGITFTADANLTATISNELAPYNNVFRNAFNIIENTEAKIGYLNIEYNSATNITTLTLRSKSNLTTTYPRAETCYICK